MTKFRLLWFFLIVNSLLLIAVNNDHFIRFADSLEKNGLVREAVTEYQRYLFLNKNLTKQEKGIIWLKLAVCYRKVNSEAEMMKAFNQAYTFIQGSVLIKEFYEEIIIFFLSRGKTELARIFINKLKRNTTDKKNESYLCLSYLMDKNWDKFFQLLNSKDLNLSQKNYVQKIVKKIKQNKKRYKLFRIIHIFIPGIIYGFYGDFLSSGESFLFHYYFLQEIFSNSALINKVINGLGVTWLYLRIHNRDREFLNKKFYEKNLQLEEKIFNIVSGLKNP